MNKDFYGLIYLVSKVLNVQSNYELPQDINWENVYNIAGSHRLLSVLYCAFEQSKQEAPKEIFSKLPQNKQEKAFYNILLDCEINNLLNEMEKRKIKVLPLKGWVIKNIYPQTELRTMSDIDLFIDEKENKLVQSTMKDMGYSLLKYGNHEDLYQKKPNISVEIHRELMPETSHIYNKYYKNFWQKANKAEGRSYIYEMSHEDFYIYHIVHMAKHISDNGIGIRHFMDTYMIYKNHFDKMDMNYINLELEKLQLKKFSEIVVHVSKNWFSENNKYPIFDEITEIFEREMLGGSVYGTTMNKEKNIVANKNKFIYILRAIFPTKKRLKARYKILHNYPVLFPVFYVKRWFDLLLFENGKTRKKTKILFTSQSEIDDRRAFFEKIGLESQNS